MKTALDMDFWDDLLTGLAMHAEQQRNRGNQTGSIRLIQLLYDLLDARIDPATDWIAVHDLLSAVGVTYRPVTEGVPPAWILPSDGTSGGHRPV